MLEQGIEEGLVERCLSRGNRSGVNKGGVDQGSSMPHRPPVDSTPLVQCLLHHCSTGPCLTSRFDWLPPAPEASPKPCLACSVASLWLNPPVCQEGQDQVTLCSQRRGREQVAQERERARPRATTQTLETDRLGPDRLRHSVGSEAVHISKVALSSPSSASATWVLSAHLSAKRRGLTLWPHAASPLVGASREAQAGRRDSAYL